MMHIDRDRLVERFLTLAQTDGITGDERRVADTIQAGLQTLGVPYEEDDAGASFDGNTGNIIARIPGTRSAGAPLLLMAHMDTVEPTAGLAPVITDGVIRSDGTTILGADDRAGISIIMEVLATLAENRLRHRPLEIVFSVGEEQGMLGSLQLDFSRLAAREGYILDCSRPPGKYVAVTPTAVDLGLTFTGRASHSGVAIENGINALSMALEVLRDFPVGQVDDETTANIGTIKGGTQVNVVPESVSATGEIRSFNTRVIERMCSDLKAAAETTARRFGGSAEVRCLEAFKGFSLTGDLPVIQTLVSVYEAMGISHEGLVYYGGSDANVVNRHGIQAVNIGVGVRNPHSHNEEIAIDDLVTTAELLLHLTGGTNGQ
ncbi:M20/M25/M40 family metallo-hydrolase [bacterium]|nr:M20/M25/M40 family metallo-hydrolase [bacterium]